MPLPDDLDPRTLRWMADEHQETAAYMVRGIENFDMHIQHLWKSRAYEMKCRAKRLRNIATRMEKAKDADRS